MGIDEIIISARNRRASDIHIVLGVPIRVRIDGELVDYDEHVLEDHDCEHYASVLSGGRYSKITSSGEIDFAYNVANIRCRVNVFRQQQSISCAIRLLTGDIPELEQLGLPAIVQNFVQYKRGIVLITGQTGSGKSTTVASLLNRINHTRRDHIITLEDPIEYVFQQDKCTINQREIGVDTETHASGLHSILREDPDVIFIGEMRSQETIEVALTAAETGHLVFATLHTNSAPDTIDRIVDSFPGEKQKQIRMQLSITLQAVLSQQLLPRKARAGRVPACEVMLPNNAIRNHIREGKSPQIANALATSVHEGNITMDNCLVQMVHNGDISLETALSSAYDMDYITKMLGYRVPAGFLRKVTE